MKIPLLIIISLIFFILITGCVNQPSPSSSPVTAMTTTQPVVPEVPTPELTSSITPMPTPTPTPTPTSVFPDSSGLTTLVVVTGQTGKTSDTFSVPTGYWELWYTADPLTTGGQDSVSASGSSSAVFPYLSIQVIDKTNSDKIVETVEPPGGLDKTLWEKSGRDPRPWKQKFYEGNKEYYFVITTKHLKSYTIEVRIPKSSS
jgi:hypothetical protein